MQLRSIVIVTGLRLQGELDLSARYVAILWDFDNLRPPGGARVAAHTAHLLQVGAGSPCPGAGLPAAGVWHRYVLDDRVTMSCAGRCP